jgi:DNA-binding response OmpR family regulator
MKGDRKRCLDAGMDDYVSKPVRRPDLMRVLLRVPVGEDTESHPADGTPIIDWTAASEILGGDPELHGRMVRGASIQIGALMNALTDAISSQELEVIATTASAVSDLARSIVATKTMTAAMLVHEAASRHDIELATKEFWYLESAFKELGQEIDSVVVEQVGDG